MGLAPGTTVGPYRIESLIGAGGMGEVYKARDTRLGRPVAIKVLPPAAAGDPDRRARFEREAKSIAALNHPNICTLHDVGCESGIDFLVMEYLDGETLAERLKKGPLPIDLALDYAIHIADALAKAHRAGIVHRDLKPGNVILTKSGAKLLDFGLAHLTQPASGAVSMTVSASGVIVGTVPYMAPEQLQGQPTDARTDLFAFGAVLYEMLTGRRAFEGNDQASVISAVMSSQPPPPSSLQALTPPLLDSVVRRCLAKSPDERWDSAHDVASELRWLQTTRATGSPLETHGSHRRGRHVLLAAVAALLCIGLGASLVWFFRPPSAPPAFAVRTIVNVAPAERLQGHPADATSGEQRPSDLALALSPDGRLLVFDAVKDGRQQLYARPLDRIVATPIENSWGARTPFFSFDGKWIGFWANGALKKVPVGGGPATTICQTDAIAGASWGDDDAIVFGRWMGGLMRVPATGGTATPLTTLDARKGEVSHRLPFVLPGSKAVLFTAIDYYLPDWEKAEVVLQPLPDGPRRVLTHGSDARYVPTGHVLFMRSGSLLAMPFDVARLQAKGGELTILDNVMQGVYTPGASMETGAGQFAVSPAGLLAYCTGGIFPQREHEVVWVDRHGTVEALPQPPPVSSYMAPRLSPDGQQIVMWTQGRERAVWVYDLRRGTPTRVTTEGRNSRPIWTLDGRRVVFTFPSGGVDQIASKAADGTGAVELLPAHGMPSSYAPDGTLAYVEQSANRTSIWLLPPGGAKAVRLLDSKFAESFPEFSPDGRWIAYVSNETGRQELYVQPYPGPGRRQRISKEGASQPAWSRDGRELFYTDGVGGRIRMISVPVLPGAGLNLGVPRVLFQGAFRWQVETRGYDVTSDGQHFLMFQRKERPPFPVTQIVLVQNWFEELKEKAPRR